MVKQQQAKANGISEPTIQRNHSIPQVLHAITFKPKEKRMVKIKLNLTGIVKEFFTVKFTNSMLWRFADLCRMEVSQKNINWSHFRLG